MSATETFDWKRAAQDRPGRGLDFQDLMLQRVQDILLVSSLYDSFILKEDGELYELLVSEFVDLDLRHTPGIRRVSSGAEALAIAREQPRFNLIITTSHVGDMNAVQMARLARQEGLRVPVVLLAYDHRELTDLMARSDVSPLDGLFLWQGDARILLAIVKLIEDRLNVAHDTAAAGVQVIIVVEDNVRYYSSFLPVIYTELLHHSHRLISEGVNLSHKIMRMRARPKILLCGTFEEAWGHYTAHEKDILGVISDVEFPRGGALDREAGVELARMIKGRQRDVAIMLHSSRPENEERAREVGAAFLRKGSSTLLNDLRRFMVESLSFGDFVFRLPDGSEVDRAPDLKALEEKLQTVPAGSIAYHAERNHFSNWLKARTEFALAGMLRPRKISDFATIEDLRRSLIRSVAGYRRERGRGTVTDFNRKAFDGSEVFSRIGGGSLGGKARGLAFVRQLLDRCRVGEAFPGIGITVPPAVVLATSVFDLFLDRNGLRDFALNEDDDARIVGRFLEAPFPEDARRDLAALLRVVRYPLAVRSSSLLEDSQYQPFTGVYETYMLPNNHPDNRVRLHRLIEAVKRVYASTFSRHAKAYLKATPYRLEEEKMAVILQKVVGSVREGRFYPDFAGVARSRNFYPIAPQKPEDGIVAVALGLGRSVVEGGNCMRFCPRYPQNLVQFSSVQDILKNSQRGFWAVKMDGPARSASPAPADARAEEVFCGLEEAEADGALAPVASTWSPENNAVYDGISRQGVRLVSFAGILKHDIFPLASILNLLLEIGPWGMGGPVEVEFAVNLPPSAAGEAEFGLLQMRPLALSREEEELEVGEVRPDQVLCRSPQVLGNGRIDGIRDLVVVDFHRFDRSSSRDAAEAVTRFNASLVAAGIPYLLIGVGRWGSADPWLGIPVAWDQISGARVIVEAGFKDFKVTPSQGTHFFQNLTAFNIGYFTVNPEAGEGSVDWDWLASRRALEERGAVRHIRLDAPLVIQMNGKRNEGWIFKPGARRADKP